MIAICWAIIAVSFTFFFIYLWLRATVYVKRRWGPGSAIIFAIVVLSLAGGNYRPGLDPVKPIGYAIKDFRNITGWNSKVLVLEKNPLYKINLFYIYGFDNQQGKMVPVISFSNMTGIILGTRWSPDEVLISPDSSGTKLHYYVSGMQESHLLNLFHHYQRKTFEGTIDVSDRSFGK